jgi:hypothetical protein
MRPVKLTSWLMVTVAAVALAAASVLAPAADAASAPGNCWVVQTPHGYRVVCSNGSHYPGGPGSGGGGGGPGGPPTHMGCQIEALNGQTPPYPAPKGQVWMRLVCNSILDPGMPGGLVLVPKGSTTHNPGVNPRELLQWALAELNVPAPTLETAPPAGHDGLVGLAEWFWVDPAQWKPIHIDVSVGPVFANLTVIPTDLTITPGAGLAAVTCPGHGTVYDKRRPASAQHSDCTYTYQQSSATQPGAAYSASVSVTWTASWVGSGGTGGPVNPPLVEHAAVRVPVAEGQGLVDSS